jgi:hypothetical protein
MEDAGYKEQVRFGRYFVYGLGTVGKRSRVEVHSNAVVENWGWQLMPG